MSNGKILIVEDNLFTAQSMRITLEGNGYFVTGTVTSGAKAMESIEKTKPDLVLMDIELKGKDNGIITARRINNIYGLHIIYVTGKHDETAFKEAKETFPLNFITKPFMEKELLRAVELGIHIAKKSPSKSEPNTTQFVPDGIFVSAEKGMKKKLLFNDILYIKAERAYATIFYKAFSVKDKEHYAIEKHTIPLSSNKVAEQLSFSALVRTHKSYFVNMQWVDKMNRDSLFIQNIEIPLGEEYKQNIMENYTRHFKHHK